MTRLMESIAQNLRKAFPRMPMSLFEDQKEVLSLGYLRKAQKYFDFAALYPVEPGLVTGEILHGGFRRVHSSEETFTPYESIAASTRSHPASTAKS